MMLLGAVALERSRTGVDKGDLPGILKTPDFYRSYTLESQHEWFDRLKKKTTVASAHRQNGFDFRILDPEVRVISIVPDLANVIAQRTIQIDHWKEEHPILSKFYANLSNDETVKYTEKIINKWATENILESDLKIPMSNLYQFEHLGLGYRKSIVDDIYNDMTCYVKTTI